MPKNDKNLTMKNLKDFKSVELNRSSLASLTGGAVWTTLDGVAQGDICAHGILLVDDEQDGSYLEAANVPEPCQDLSAN